MTSTSDLDSTRLPEGLHRFGPDFVFGTATAAYQIEGAVAEDGRTAELASDLGYRWPVEDS